MDQTRFQKEEVLGLLLGGHPVRLQIGEAFGGGKFHRRNGVYEIMVA